MNKQPRSSEQYLRQLAAALQEGKIDDIDDIVADYKDYFAQSKTKGYSDEESIQRLPKVQELAASYIRDDKDFHALKSAKYPSGPSRAQRLTIFGASLAGDMILLPIFGLAALLLACFTVVGVFLVVTGPLLFIPDSMLGQVDVARPPLLQILPTALLLISGGALVIGICTAIAERMYSTIRASIVVRRWLLTGEHDNHLKLVPQISKRLRTLLYRISLFAALSTVSLIVIVMILSLITAGTINFPSTWKQ